MRFIRAATREHDLLVLEEMMRLHKNDSMLRILRQFRPLSGARS